MYQRRREVARLVFVPKGRKNGLESGWGRKHIGGSLVLISCAATGFSGRRHPHLPAAPWMKFSNDSLCLRLGVPRLLISSQLSGTWVFNRGVTGKLVPL